MNGESGYAAGTTANSAQTDWIVQLVEKSGACVCYGPRDLSRFDYASPGFSDVFGIPREKLYENALAFSDLVHPDDREALMRHLCADDSWERSIDYRIVRPDGVRRWVRCRTFPLNDPNGEPAFLAAAVRDVTEHYQTTSDVLESMQEGYVALDELWRISYANRIAIETVGLPRSQILGRELWTLSPSIADSEFAKELRAARRDGKDRQFETNRLQAGKWYEITAHPHDSGLSVFARDITLRKRALEAVRQQEARFRTIFEHAPVGLLVLDRERIVQEVNPKLCQWLGRSAETMTGRDVLTFVAEDDRERYLAIRDRVLRVGFAHVEFPFRHADGSRVELDWSVTRDALPGMNMGVALEIGERKAAQRAQSLLVGLYESSRDMPDPVELMRDVCAMLRRTLGVTSCCYGRVGEAGEAELPEGSPSALAGYGPGVLRDLRAGSVVSIDDRLEEDRLAGMEPAFRSHILVPLVRQGRLAAVFAVQNDGVRRWREEEVQLVRRIAENSWLAYERAAAEQELRRTNQDLESRVEARTAELQTAVRELEGFTYSVSHDLRGPLRSIMASAMMLREDFGGQIGSEGQDQLARVANAAKKMATLIDELLKISRLNRQEMRIEPLDLSALAREVASEIGRPAEFHIRPGLAAPADARLMRLVLWNLFDNATKYAAKGRPPVVEFGRDDRGFYVRDNGIGFDRAYAEKIFEPFERLVRDAEYPGTGVGLANVRRIVQRHGGKVWAESEPGMGAVFYFDL